MASRRRTGTVVTGRRAVPAEARLHALAADLVVEARASGVDDEGILRIVRAALLHGG